MNVDFENYDINDHYKGEYKERYQFMMIGYDLITSEKMSKPNIRLYFWLRRYVRKIKSDYDRMGIFDKYYAKGYLATSWRMETLARKLKASKSTIKSWLNELVRDGGVVIKKEKNPVSGRRQNVYVLGEIDEKREVYYYEGQNSGPHEG